MIIRRIKREYALYYSIYMAFFAIVGAVFFHIFAPQYAFKAFWLIPTWFYLIGLATGVSYIFVEHMMPHRTVHYHLVQKTVKLFLCMAVIVLYVCVGGSSRKVFLLTFLAYYFLNMCYEVWFFCRIEIIKKMIERDDRLRKRYRKRLTRQ